MHKIFGTKLNVTYTDRKGAYLIPIDGTKIAIVETPKGYFFLGGGIEADETDRECIRRECLEEIGYSVDIGQFLSSAETYTIHSVRGYFHPIQTYYSGKLLKQIQPPLEQDHRLLWVEYEELRGKLYPEMQNWALEEYWKKRHT